MDRQRTLESSAENRSQTNYTKNTPVTASRAMIQRDNFTTSNDSAKLLSMNSGFYNKDQIYQVKGNRFSNKKGTLK